MSLKLMRGGILYSYLFMLGLLMGSLLCFLLHYDLDCLHVIQLEMSHQDP